MCSGRGRKVTGAALPTRSLNWTTGTVSWCRGRGWSTSVAPPAAGPTTPVPGPAAPSARPGGDGATAAESAAATTFARLVRQHCDLARVPNPAQVRASDLGDGVFQIVDANATVMQIDVDSNIVMAADSLDGSVSGGYSEACAPALFGG